MNRIKIKILRIKDVPLPAYKSRGAAGMDICSAEDTVVKAGKFVSVSTGIAVEIPEGYEIEIRPRSGLSANHGIGILNSPGTIDSDYRGEIKVILFNFSDRDFHIKKGDRIAQMVVKGVVRAELIEVKALSETDRGEGGFGSTGI